MSTTYNGWKNRETWNIALWIGNDEPLYRAAVDFMRRYKGRQPYRHFIQHQGLSRSSTPDRIQFLSTRISLRELNAMMNGFRPEYMA